MSAEEELFQLFDDLESQAQAAYARDREAELADRTRSAYAAVSLASRLMASVGAEITVELGGVGQVGGTLETVAAGWFELSGAGSRWVVRQPAVTLVAGVSERAVPEIAWSPLARLGLGSALRRLAEGGERCLLHLLDGGRLDGVLRRVGADFVEVAAPARTVLVAFERLAAVQIPG